ncbi:MAG: sulfotransferase family protein [Acidimicrobiales bacterium]
MGIARASGVTDPIILLGAPRSGTSLLAEVLAAHPDVGLAREPRLVWRYGNDRRSDQLRPEHARPDVVVHIHGSFAELLAQTGGTRLVEKTPANSVRPGFVDVVFPDARYVHITRDGWGAVPSIRSFWERRSTGFDARQVRKLRRRLREAHPAQLRHYAVELGGRLAGGRRRRTPLYGPRLAGLQTVADELGVLTAAGLQWRTCVESSATFGRALEPGRYLEIQLETLHGDSIESVVSFCGLRPSPEVGRAFKDAYRRETATRRAPLTDNERAIVAPFVDPVNPWLGYHPLERAVDVGHDDQQTPPVRVSSSETMTP